MGKVVRIGLLWLKRQEADRQDCDDGTQESDRSVNGQRNRWSTSPTVSAKPPIDKRHDDREHEEVTVRREAQEIGHPEKLVKPQATPGKGSRDDGDRSRDPLADHVPRNNDDSRRDGPQQAPNCYSGCAHAVRPPFFVRLGSIRYVAQPAARRRAPDVCQIVRTHDPASLTRQRSIPGNLKSSRSQLSPASWLTQTSPFERPATTSLGPGPVSSA